MSDEEEDGGNELPEPLPPSRNPGREIRDTGPKPQSEASGGPPPRSKQ